MTLSYLQFVLRLLHMLLRLSTTPSTRTGDRRYGGTQGARTRTRTTKRGLTKNDIDDSGG